MDVDEKLRTPAYEIEDGVTCEACHGRAEKWLSPHQFQESWRARSPDERKQLGFYDLITPVHRAERCLKCHLGTAEEEVTHAMLAAGHPPLTFELVHDLKLVPVHWEEDAAAYLDSNEGGWFTARLWAVGQAVTLRESMYRLRHWVKESNTIDFAVFECYACHHDLTKATWRQQRSFPKITGEPVLDLSSWAMCKALADVVSPNDAEKLKNGADQILATVSFIKPDSAGMIKAASELAQVADRLARKAEKTLFDREKIVRLLRVIASDGHCIGGMGYEAARQAFLAMHALYSEALVTAAGEPQNHEEIQALLRSLKSYLYNDSEEERPGAYDFFRFRELMGKLAAQFEAL